MVGIIYKSTNTITGESYIGSTTKSLRERKNQHLRSALIDETRLFSSSIYKYGKENFEWNVLCECDSEEELEQKEKEFIFFYNTCGKNGYNMTQGGRGIRRKLFKTRTIIILENDKKLVINNYDIDNELIINTDIKIKWIKTHKFYK
jgi:group I intron endonuclease